MSLGRQGFADRKLSCLSGDTSAVPTPPTAFVDELLGLFAEAVLADLESFPDPDRTEPRGDLTVTRVSAEKH